MTAYTCRKHMISRFVFSGMLLFMIILLSAACGNSLPPSQKSVKLGMLRIEDNLPFFLAEQEKIFARNNVPVELVGFNSARERDIAMEAGEIQGEVADLLAAALLRKGGTPVKAVSLALGVLPSEGRFAILAAPSSPIRYPAQLANVPVAISQNTIIHYLAEEMLIAKGIQPDQIKLKNIPDLNIRLEALIAGADIQAALLPEPLVSLAERQGATVIIDDTRLSLNLSQTVIIFREDFLQTNPAAIRSILQSYQEGAELIDKNWRDFQDLIMSKAGVPKSLEGVYSPPHYSKLVQPSREMVTRVMDWMVKNELLSKAYSYGDLVAEDFQLAQ